MKEDKSQQRENKKGYHQMTRMFGERVLLVRTGNTVFIKNMINNGKRFVVGKDYGHSKCNIDSGDVFDIKVGRRLAYNRMKRIQLRRQIKKEKKKLRLIEKKISIITDYKPKKKKPTSRTCTRRGRERFI